ncbi:MAG: bifunctional phosphoglucose/phosphomannose isomerase [Armatimonadetes bacterium]|nr:bifunctional phosphoglucose/phosphomannose isomerase [Armatimonadota bacterium]
MTTVINLDNPLTWNSLDSKDMAGTISEFPSQFSQSWEMTRNLDIPPFAPQNVLILGMGGSAIGGDILRSLVADELSVPLVVHRGYHAPAFVSEKTLVLAVSYSGNTEETLAACEEARKKGARIITYSSGGTLKERASATGNTHVTLRSGLMPRAAIGYTFLPLLVTLSKLKVIPDFASQIEETRELLKQMSRELRDTNPMEKNPAKQLAEMLYIHIPVIYASHGFLETVALRWKQQIHENGKCMASCNVLPELNHNEIVGWSGANKGLEKHFGVVILREPGESARIRKRVEFTAEAVSARASFVKEVWARGESRLARMFSLLYFGDFVSLYLAFLWGEDPTPIPVIDRLKQELTNG